jgi:hypothetical protein
MKLSTTFCLLLSSVFFITCHNTVYKDNNYRTEIKQLKSIAILPPKINLNGKEYSKMSIEEKNLYKQEVLDLYQNQIQHVFLLKSPKRVDGSNIYVQPFEKTNKILLENYDLSQINDVAPGELCEKLNVDAILKTNVFQKNLLTRNEANTISSINQVASQIKSVPIINLKSDEVSIQLHLLIKKEEKIIFSSSGSRSISINRDLNNQVKILFKNLLNDL